MNSQENKRGKRLTGGVLTLLVVGMIGLSFASAPLYRLFCQVTGFGGTTQVAEQDAVEVLDRVMTVRFNADISRDLDWDFRPLQTSVDVQVGATELIYFRATNRSAHQLVGTATFNVTPLKAGIYFNKIECFCFTEQTLAPGESVDMAVSFFIDPDIANDQNLDDVRTITLSYTFFPVGVSESRRGGALKSSLVS